jgi:dipeptidyl aminopeptidase/acylaminoacyl peptidase
MWKMIVRWLAAGALCAAHAMAVAAGAAGALVPLADFFKQPSILQAELSPSGRWLAMSSSQLGERIVLVVFDLQDWGKVQVAAHFSDADIRSFHWVNEERLVVEVIDFQKGSGDQTFNPSLFSVRRDGSDMRNLIEPRGQFLVGERRPGREPLRWNHLLLHVPGGGGDEVIVGEFVEAGVGEQRDVLPKRLNVVTGRTQSLAAGAPPHSRRWWFDAAGQPRVVLTSWKGRDALYWKPDGADAWTQTAEFDRLAAPFQPQFFDAAGDFYVTVPSGPEGYGELRRYDLKQRKLADDAVVKAPGFDFHGALATESVGGKTLGVRVETDAWTTVWFDARLKALQEEADRKLPGRVNQLWCRRCSEPDMVVLVESASDRDPGQYLLYRADTKAWRLIGPRRPAIDPRQMAARDLVRLRARDGRDLPVWITGAPASGAGPRPAVVLVHGGPWARGGHWRWSALPQFLASRGYVVVEPEFRGSTGYGTAHREAGNKQWGLAMQDDVADALLWAVAKGMADGKRACIAGGSYGGYATLMGLVRDPQLYRCGAAWVAVTDLMELQRWSSISDISEDFRQYDLPRLVGDPVKDEALLKASSPMEQAARIKAPVLLAMGALDRRVPLEHGTRMRDALRAAGQSPEWIVYDNEGHGWLTLQTKLDFFQRLERFLERHLKDR